jgi:type III secretion system-like peptide-binding chaperone
MAVDATSAKVQRMLVSGFNDVRLTKDGGFSLPMGSTTVFVEIKEWTPDKDNNARSLVYLWSPLGREVPISPELFEWSATEGRQKWFGGVNVQKSEDGKTAFVTYDHTLLGNTLDPDELTSAVSMVGWTADDLDDVVTTKFGGKRWSDT